MGSVSFKIEYQYTTKVYIYGNLRRMHTIPSKRIIAIGELLVDLISDDYVDDFRRATTFRRIAGGSPANVAMNLARLGCPSDLIATIGKGGAGDFVLAALKEAGVNGAHVRRVAAPTTLVLVTKSQGTSDFEVYRSADCHITAEQLSRAGLDGAGVVHTTAFALSKQPARTAILGAMEAAAGGGSRLSIDFNYADKVWGGDRSAALRCLRTVAGRGALLKFSDVDYERLFDEPVGDPAGAAGRLLGMGASVVCLTLGARGVYLLTSEEGRQLPARPVDVVDTTGAGDAFWSGFLAAYVQGYPPYDCAVCGRSLAERKLTRLGPVTERLEVTDLLRAE